MKGMKSLKQLKLSVPAQDTPVTNFLTASGTFQDGDLLLNRTGLRLISEETKTATKQRFRRRRGAAVSPILAEPSPPSPSPLLKSRWMLSWAALLSFWKQRKLQNIEADAQKEID